MAAAQHQQSFSFFNLKRERESNEDNTKEMDKVECVDWPTQKVDRDKIPILLSLSFNRMRVFIQSNTYTDIFRCC